MTSKHTPYTYLIGWTAHNKFYYGRRTQKGCDPNELWVSYFTSSKLVKQFRKLHGEPDLIEVRKTFPSDVTKCQAWETKVLRRLKAAELSNWLNQVNGDLNWSTTGKVTVTDTQGNQMQIDCNDPRYLSGEFVPLTRGKPQRSKNKGTVVVKSNDGSSFRVSLDDPRYVSGELKGVKTGYVNVKDSNGNIFQVEKTDPRYVSGELKHHSHGVSNTACKGMVTVRDSSGLCYNVPKTDPRYLSGELKQATKGRPSKFRGISTGPFSIVSCPHCGATGGVNAMKRWHFEKCRSLIT